jgi:integrative and conjugative element protein (TIGR02256 family)
VINPYLRSTQAMIGGLPGREDAWVLIEAAVFDRVNPFRQRESAAPESGGILLGYRRGAHLHVVQATTPGHGDHGTRGSFRRSANGHREQALSGWHSSDHTLDYLGEWHTHPEPMPSPSGTDHRAWRELLAARLGRPLVFMILGIDDGIWLGYGHGNVLSAISIEPELLENARG